MTVKKSHEILINEKDLDKLIEQDKIIKSAKNSRK